MEGERSPLENILLSTVLFHCKVPCISKSKLDEIKYYLKNVVKINMFPYVYYDCLKAVKYFIKLIPFVLRLSQNLYPITRLIN